MGYNKSLATFQLCRLGPAAIKHKVVAHRIAASKWRPRTSGQSRQRRAAHRRKACYSPRLNHSIRETSCQANSKPMPASTLLQPRAAVAYRPIRAVVPRCLLVAV